MSPTSGLSHRTTAHARESPSEDLAVVALHGQAVEEQHEPEAVQEAAACGSQEASVVLRSRHRWHGASHLHFVPSQTRHPYRLTSLGYPAYPVAVRSAIKPKPFFSLKLRIFPISRPLPAAAGGGPDGGMPFPGGIGGGCSVNRNSAHLFARRLSSGVT